MNLIAFLPYLYILISPVQSAELAIDKKTENQNIKVSSNSCPQVLIDQNKEDSRDGFLGILKNKKSTCKGAVAYPQTFQTKEDLRLELKDKYKARFSVDQSSAIRRCSGSDDNDKYQVAKFYYNAIRFDNGIKSAVTSISELNLLLGLAPLDGVISDDKKSCAPSLYSEVEKLCTDLSKCPSQPNQLAEIAERTMEADAIIRHVGYLESRVKIFKRGSDGKTTFDDIEKIKAEIEKLKPLADNLRQQYPWLQKEAFRAGRAKGEQEERLLSSSASDKQRLQHKIKYYSDAIKAQAEVDKKDYIARLSVLTTTSSCLTGTKNTCEADDFNDVLSSTPDPTASDFSYGGDRRGNTATQYLEMQNCIFYGNEDKNKTSTDLAWSTFDAGTTLLTFGVPIVAGARAALVAGLRTSRSLKLTAEVGSKSRLAIRTGQIAAAIDISNGLAYAGSESIKCKKERALAMQKLEAQNKNICTISETQKSLTELNDCETLSTLVLAALPLIHAITQKVPGPLTRKIQDYNQESKLVQREISSLPPTLSPALASAETAAIKSTVPLYKKLDKLGIDHKKYFLCSNNDKACKEGLSKLLADNKVSAKDRKILQKLEANAVRDRIPLAKVRAEEDLEALGDRVEAKDFSCRGINAYYPGAFETANACKQIIIKKPVKGEYCACTNRTAPGQYFSRCANVIAEFITGSKINDQSGLPYQNSYNRCFRMDLPEDLKCYAGGNGRALGGLGGGAQLFCPTHKSGKLSEDADAAFDNAKARGEVTEADRITDISKAELKPVVTRWSPFTENFPNIVDEARKCQAAATKCPIDSITQINKAYNAQVREVIKEIRSMPLGPSRQRRAEQFMKERREFKIYLKQLRETGETINYPGP